MKNKINKQMKKIKAYKVFNNDFKCRDYQFEVGKSYKEKDAVACNIGFHACIDINDCWSYYSFDSDNKVALVELWGKIDDSEGDKICATNIKIVKELTWQEVLVICNIGKDNTGYGNSGDLNSGNRNSGNRNSGNRNSGNRNSGNLNSGYRNSGYRNSGDLNSGDLNSGNRNSGNRNSGNRNSGDLNSGDLNSGDLNSGDLNSGDLNSGNRNSGYRNSGDLNSGDLNSGNRNSGNRNSGNRNSGNRNSGDLNSGNRNSGDWNSINKETGYFNSNQSKTIRVFNKKCKLEDWENANKPDLIYNIILNEWINWSNMSDEEKEQYPKSYVCEGYLKRYEYKEAWQIAYNKAIKEDIELLKALPNFNSKVFKEITGIEV